MQEYMTTQELANQLGYSPRYINRLRNIYFKEGIHFIRPFGGSIRYLWSAAEKEINKNTKPSSEMIPMNNGGYCHG